MNQRRMVRNAYGEFEDTECDDIYGCRSFPMSRFRPVMGKEDRFETNLHYSDPDANKEHTVFGRAQEHLFYNYSDRLIGDKWREGQEKAKAAGLEPNTALWYETILNTFHGVDNVDLQHVILGCNLSNGFSYLVFGYTYGGERPERKSVKQIKKELGLEKRIL